MEPALLRRPWHTWLVFLNFVVALITVSNLWLGFRLFGSLRDFVVETGFAFWGSVVQLLAAILVSFVLLVEPGSAARGRVVLLGSLPVVWIGQALTLVSLALRLRYEHEVYVGVAAGAALALLYVVVGGKAWSELLRLVLLERAGRP